MRVSPCIELAFTSLLIASSAFAADGKRQIGQFSGCKVSEEALGKMIIPVLKQTATPKISLF